MGRTGTFIAFDILQQQVTKDRIVYVYGCVERLRGERMSMVQTKVRFHGVWRKMAILFVAVTPCKSRQFIYLNTN